MFSKPLSWLIAILSIAFIFYSCKKDDSLIITPTEENNPVVPNSPNNGENVEGNVNVELPNSGTTHIPIGVKEIKESIKVKTLLRDLVRESFTQLLYNHDYNPFFPAVDTRVACNCPTAGVGGTPVTDCGSPSQVNSAPTGTYPQTVTLTYVDDVSCGAVTLAPSGLEVFGELQITFSAPFTDEHSIQIVPQSNFMINGNSVITEPNGIGIYSPPGGYFPGGFPGTPTGPSGYNENLYQITGIDSLQVTDPSGATTVTDQGSMANSYLLISDVGSNHGDPTNAFGILDDIFTFNIFESDALTVMCSNGTEVIEYTQEPVVYNMACSCIQSGVVIMDIPNTPFDPIYNYGYVDPTSGQSPGECDDLIEVTTPCPSIQGVPSNSAATRNNVEIINCL